MQSKDKIKLIGFAIFIIVIIIPIIFTKNKSQNEVKNDNSTNVQEKTIESQNDIYQDIKNLLNQFNYEFSFIVIDVNQQKVLYQGKTLNEETVGYKETSSEMKKFYINEDNVYDYSNLSQVYIGKISDVSYNEFLNFEKIFEIGDNSEKEYLDDSVYFRNDDYEFSLSLVSNNEINIKIISNNDEIELNYFNINNINNIR